MFVKFAKSTRTYVGRHSRRWTCTRTQRLGIFSMFLQIKCCSKFLMLELWSLNGSRLTVARSSNCSLLSLLIPSSVFFLIWSGSGVVRDFLVSSHFQMYFFCKFCQFSKFLGGREAHTSKSDLNLVFRR